MSFLPVQISECEYIKIFNVQKINSCDTQINDNMHDMV